MIPLPLRRFARAVAAVCALATVASAHVDADDARPAAADATLPIYSARFLGTPSPFHETVATLILKGAKLQPASVASALWRQGLGRSNVGSYHIPMFDAKAPASRYTFHCVTYGKCNADGLRVSLPAGAAASADSDHHLIVFDDALGGELDGWGGDGDPKHQCNVTAAQIDCSWGGFFPYRGNGLDGNSGSSANNGGYAFGLFDITAGEIVQGHIDHALGLVASCLDDPDIYPADTSKHTDASCTKAANTGQPQYGQLIHLKNSYDIASSAYSPACKTILTALQTFGAYTYDTNAGYGIALGVEDTTRYAEPNPWVTTIFPQMVRYGDGAGHGEQFHDESCFNRLSAADIEIFDLAPGT